MSTRDHKAVDLSSSAFAEAASATGDRRPATGDRRPRMCIAAKRRNLAASD